MKKVFLAFLMVSILITSFNISIASADTAEVDSEAIYFAKTLGFISEDVKGSDTATKAEFAKLIAQLAGYTEPKVDSIIKYKARNGSITQYDYKKITGKPIFKDVPAEYWAVGYIEYAALNGYVTGTKDDKYLFAPNEMVTLVDVYRSMIKLLGYQDMIELRGGGNVGIEMVAKEANIVAHPKNSVVDMETVAQILYKTMCANIMTPKKYNTENGVVEYSKEKTYMEYAYNLHLLKNAVITANDMTNLLGSSPAPKGNVVINDALYDDKTGRGNKYIGYQCDIFYEQSDNDDLKTVQVVIPKAKEEKNIQASDDLSFTKRYATYYENEQIKKVIFSSVMDVIYNNQLLKTWSANDLNISDGNYTFVDNNGDGEIDLLKIEAYEYMLVKDVQTSSMIITGQYQYPDGSIGITRLSVDDTFNGAKQDVRYVSEGKAATIDDIKTNSVLSITRSKGTSKQVIIIDISNDSAKLTIDGIDSSEGETKVICADVAYTVSKALYDSGNTLKLGDVGTAFFTNTNKILAFYKESSSDLMYGYLLKIAKTSKISDAYEFKILTSDGNWNIFSSFERIKVNSISGKASTVLKNSGLATFDDSTGEINSVTSQIVRYRQTMNKLSEIQTVAVDLTTAATVDQKEKMLQDAINNDDFRLCHSGSYRHYGSLKNLNWDILCVQDVPTFLIPGNPQLANEDDFVVRESDFFTYNTPYDVSSYDENIFGQPKILVVNTDSSSSVSPSMYLFAVDKMTKNLDENNNEVTKLQGLYKGKEEKFILKESLLNEKGVETYSKDFRQGNVLKIALSAKNEIENYSVVYDPIEMGEYLRVSTFAGSSNTMFGRVMNISDPDKMIRLKGDMANDGINCIKSFWIVTKNPFVAIYDKNKKSVQLATFADIESGDYVVVRTEDLKPSAFIVFRNIF